MNTLLNPGSRRSTMAAAMYYARKRARLARIAANSPEAFWTLDPATFTSPNFTDSAGNVLASTGGFTSGNIGTVGGKNAATFNGSDYAVSSLQFPATGAMGIRVYPTSYNDWQGPCGWKPNPTTGYCIFDNGGGGAPGTWRFVFNPAGSSEVDITGPAIVQNTWNTLFAQWALQGTTWTFAFWINGTLIGTGSYTGVAAALGDFAIGNTGDGNWNPYTGAVADATVWTTLPTATAQADYGVSQ
jgi:hypothetical protein